MDPYSLSSIIHVSWSPESLNRLKRCYLDSSTYSRACDEYHLFKSIWDLWVCGDIIWQTSHLEPFWGVFWGISLCFSSYLVSWFHSTAGRINSDRWFLTLPCRSGPTLAACCRPLTWMATPTRISSWSDRRCTWAQKEMSRDKSTCTNSTRYEVFASCRNSHRDCDGAAADCRLSLFLTRMASLSTSSL